jgi:hypothetical protein
MDSQKFHHYEMETLIQKGDLRNAETLIFSSTEQHFFIESNGWTLPLQ